MVNGPSFKKIGPGDMNCQASGSPIAPSNAADCTIAEEVSTIDHHHSLSTIAPFETSIGAMPLV
jgi:hypothetical protein